MVSLVTFPLAVVVAMAARSAPGARRIAWGLACVATSSFLLASDTYLMLLVVEVGLALVGISLLASGLIRWARRKAAQPERG